MRRTRFLVLTGMLVLSCAARGASAETRKVYVVHSYHEGQVEHVDEMSRGIVDALKGADVAITYFYMDTKRHTDEAWKQEAGRKALEQALELKPDVVITMDDDAQKYFAMDYSARPDAAPLVFSGVNMDMADYGFPKENVTGVLERPHLVESIELLQKICPNVKKIVLLADVTPTTEGFYRYAKTLHPPVEILGYEEAETFEQFQETVRKYENQADAFGLYVLRAVRVEPGSDERVPEKDLIEWLHANSTLPTVGFFDTAAKSGVMCGICVSMFEQGYAAGVIARQILEGKRPTDFEVKPTTDGRIMLNLQTAERKGVKVRYSIIQNAKEVIR